MKNFSSRLSAYSLIGFTIAGIAIGSPAVAADRMQTITETCESVKQSLLSNGPTLLIYASATMPNLTLHDIYVGSAGQCAYNELGRNVVIRSSDTDKCHVILCVKEDATPAPPPPIKKEIIIIDNPDLDVR